MSALERKGRMSESEKHYEIPIIEGHNPKSYFWIMPVIAQNGEQIWNDRAEFCLDSEISIEEGYVDCFLAYFFLKHFDIDYWCNRSRFFTWHVQGEEPDRHGFEWNLEDNFYSYESIEKMIFEMELVARLLEIDYDNPLLDAVKSRFSIYYLGDYEDSMRDRSDDAEIKKRKAVIIDFYRRFASRMRKMMTDNPQTDKISICGP